MQECIDHCRDCEALCLESVAHCLGRGGKHAEAEHITQLIACADICATSAKFMLLGAAEHPTTCRACADVCDACGAACEALGDDEMMQRCAAACRRCAESCRQMTGSNR